jgi:ABC-type transporter Mla MlaB component
MIPALRHQLETSGESATLYLSGSLTSADAQSLCDLCAALPPRVHTLRLDMHGVSRLDADAMCTVRAVLRHWRSARGGDFRLSFSTKHMIATLAEGNLALPRRIAPWLPQGGGASEAMTAAFL